MNADKSDCIPKVLHVVTSLDCGGLERLVVDWTNARNAKWPGSTTICCLDKEGALAKQVNGDAVICLNANRARFPWDKKAVRKLWSVACHGVAVSEAGSSAPSIGIIHSHNLAAQQYAYLAARKAGIKHIYSQHGANIHNLGLKDRLRSRILCRMTDKVVAVSESVKESMMKRQRVSEERIDVIRNGVGQVVRCPLSVVSDLRRSLGLAEDRFVIGSVGRLERVKGYDRIINTFAKISETLNTGGDIELTHPIFVSPDARQIHPSVGEDESASIPSREGSAKRGVGCPITNSPINQSSQQKVVLLLVGDGAERQNLEQQARELGVGDRVFFAGFQEDMSKYYAAMDLFVMPSRSEGLPMALLEAMAAGVPVAVTDVGECREVVEDGKVGLLLPEDESLWAEVLRNHFSEDRKMIERGAARVMEKYSLDKTLEEYEKMYGELEI